MPGRLLIPTTVVVEVCWLLEVQPEVEAAFLDGLAAGAMEMVPFTTADAARTASLARQYGDFALGAVDASVIAIAERLGIDRIATLDRRHFTAVRPRHVNSFTLLPD